MTFYTNDEGYLVTPEKLEYGSGYSLVEVSAPYGYVLNSAPVSFDVTADNATEESSVTVVEVTKPNMAQKGIIKISKSGEVFATVTESDGIYQPVYEVEGLRSGDYTISEVSNSASQNYVLPADKKATVFEGAVTKVEMHNELRDTPKTGDDSNPALWIALMGIAAVGAVTCGVFGIKNKKKKEDAE